MLLKVKNKPITSLQDRYIFHIKQCKEECSLFESMVIPAIRKVKDFEKVLQSDHKTIVLLETRISQLEDLVKYAHRHEKKVLVHTDLIYGLKADKYGIEFLINNVKVDGIISTRGEVISQVKRQRIVAIQRLFALDSHALDHNLEICKRVQPDYIEILPAILPGIIKEVHEETGIPIIAGGLIRTEEDVQEALDNGVVAVTTSAKRLWNFPL